MFWEVLFIDNSSKIPKCVPGEITFNGNSKHSSAPFKGTQTGILVGVSCKMTKLPPEMLTPHLGIPIGTMCNGRRYTIEMKWK